MCIDVGKVGSGHHLISYQDDDGQACLFVGRPVCRP